MPVHALQPQPDSEGSDLDQLTLLYKALADQLRLQILRLLRNESFGVLELCRILEIKQSALSHHLKILATADVVTTRREGNSIFYRRNFFGTRITAATSRPHCSSRLISASCRRSRRRRSNRFSWNAHSCR